MDDDKQQRINKMLALKEPLANADACLGVVQLLLESELALDHDQLHEYLKLTQEHLKQAFADLDNLL